MLTIFQIHKIKNSSFTKRPTKYQPLPIDATKIVEAKDDKNMKKSMR